MDRRRFLQLSTTGAAAAAIGTRLLLQRLQAPLPIASQPAQQGFRGDCGGGAVGSVFDLGGQLPGHLGERDVGSAVQQRRNQ